MTLVDTRISNDRRFATVVGGVALVSLVTMPITAIWFLFVGLGIVATGSVRAMTASTDVLRRRAFQRHSLLGIAVLLGPVIYLGLALLR